MNFPRLLRLCKRPVFALSLTLPALTLSSCDPATLQKIKELCSSYFLDAGTGDKNPFKLGSFLFKNDSPNSISYIFDLSSEEEMNYRFDDGGNGTIPAMSEVNVSVWLRYQPTGMIDHNFTVNFHDPLKGHPDATNTLMAHLLADPRPWDKIESGRGLINDLDYYDLTYLDFLSYATGAPIGKLIAHSNQLLDPKIPESNIEQILYTGAIFDRGKGEKGGVCVQGDFGLRVCPTVPGADPGGPAVAMIQVLDADLVLDDPTDSFVYSFVFDTDDSDANNWVPLPAFANDFFQGTDRWYQIRYTPATDWELVVKQVVDPTTFPEDDSETAAYALLEGNALMLVVPLAEIGGVDARFRMTSFRFSDIYYGQVAPFDWSADLWPALDEPLAELPDI